MSVALYVLDTSYLVELFGCGRDSNPAASAEVRRLFKEANNRGGRFFVPLPCLFELGDHIADVKHEELRARLAAQLAETVTKCLGENKPWTITPTGLPQDVLPELLKDFSCLASSRQVGLVDAFTASEAKRLKANLRAYKARVHIWTNDRSLKVMEPDIEEGPYFW
jgi:hypothetical protein